MKIEWKCCVCREIVDSGDGHITVSRIDINRVREWMRSRETAFPIAFDRPAYPELPPGPARWKIYHLKCDPNPDTRSEYWMDISAIETASDLLNTTAHLLEKRWLQYTDWHRVIGVATAAFA